MARRIECNPAIDRCLSATPAPRLESWAAPPGPPLTDSQRFDVLVLGSGIAGLFYALRVADTARVAIVTKKLAADSATNWAQGGIAAVQDEEDSFEAHAEDTIVADAGLCQPEVVRRVVERGPVMIDALL